MLDIVSIENALYTWIFGVTNIETLFAHPNAPRPETGQYITIHAMNIVSKGIAEAKGEAQVNDSVNMDYSNLEDILVSINTFRGAAQQLATTIKDSLARITVTDQLWAAGLGYNKATGVQEIPEIINKRWEERAQFDCFFYTRSLDEENIEMIKKIQVTNELDGTTTTIE